MLKQCYPAFKSGKHVHFIIDTHARDSFLFEGQILKIVNSYLGKPYTIDFARIGIGTTLAQKLLPLIFLKSEFSLDLLKKGRRRKPIRIFRIWAEETSSALFRISQKFLECRKCSDSERKKLGLDHDLSSEEDAIKFFEECVELYTRFFHRDAVFFFRNMRPNTQMMSSPSTLRFLEKIERELPTAIVMVIPKQIEHYLLPIWDRYSYVVLQKIIYEDIEKIVERVCASSDIQEELEFSQDGIQLFCRRMRSLFGKKIPASAIIRAINDAISFKKLHQVDVINSKVVSELFSTIQVKFGSPKARPPSECKSPYFGREVERLIRECQRHELDPDSALPYPFRYALWNIRNGYIIYDVGDDTFMCRRFLEYKHFKNLSRSLYRLGYMYVHGTRSWVFRY